MKAKLSGIIALVGAALATIYMVILFIDFIQLISYIPIGWIIRYVIGFAAAPVSIIAGLRTLKSKDLTSVILRGVAIALLIVFGALVVFEALVIISIIVLAASIAVDYLVK